MEDWAQQVELNMEDPDRLGAMTAEIRKDPDLGDRERDQLLDRIAVYVGDAAKADPEGDVDDSDEDNA